ncbi:MAG: hypothetical protein LBS44_07100 [Deltaproteobacteria bacterium]|jgi:hypothetical protein|nr:hypothetical protein [Deltaproteobacteria bacterium]
MLPVIWDGEDLRVFGEIWGENGQGLKVSEGWPKAKDQRGTKPNYNGEIVGT